MGEQRRTEVRSFRSVFALERRIYRIDRLRLNPGGVPVRGVGYALALLVVAQIAQRLPGADMVTGIVPWPLRDLIVPVAQAAALSGLRVDGRPAHHALAAVLRFMVSRRHLSGFMPCAAVGTVWRPGPLAMLPDGSQGEVRSLRYCGPGRVLVRAGHTTRPSAGFRGRQLDIYRASRSAPQARGIRVAAGGVLRVRWERTWARR
jgi:hypothetical protein